MGGFNTHVSVSFVQRHAVAWSPTCPRGHPSAAGVPLVPGSTPPLWCACRPISGGPMSPTTPRIIAGMACTLRRMEFTQAMPKRAWQEVRRGFSQGPRGGGFRGTVGKRCWLEKGCWLDPHPRGGQGRYSWLGAGPCRYPKNRQKSQIQLRWHFFSKIFDAKTQKPPRMLFLAMFDQLSEEFLVLCAGNFFQASPVCRAGRTLCQRTPPPTLAHIKV